jgi:hypothetical protein
MMKRVIVLVSTTARMIRSPDRIESFELIFTIFLQVKIAADCQEHLEQPAKKVNMNTPVIQFNCS